MGGGGMKIQTLREVAQERGEYSEVRKLESKGSADRLLAWFEGMDEPVFVREAVCGNPDCPCTSVLVGLSTRDQSLSTKMSVDVNTWQDVSEAHRGVAEQALVDEFLRDMPAWLREKWAKDFHREKEHQKRLASARIDRQKMWEREMVSWLTIFGEKSVHDGGNSVTYSFSLGGNEYLVEDLYCPDPECDCGEALLVFLCRGQEAVRQVFMAKVRVGASPPRPVSMDVYEGSEREARRIYQAFVDAHPGAARLVKVRDREVKQVGRRMLDEDPSLRLDRSAPKEGRSVREGSVPKVGRNAPCPCGSGKKYKKCCGR
jgi:hypothetical protein